MAQKYNKTNVQIILRWHIQEGNIIFTKSTNLQHIKENFDIFDFSLTEEEMWEIKKVVCNKRFFNMTLEEQERTLGNYIPEN